MLTQYLRCIQSVVLDASFILSVFIYSLHDHLDSAGAGCKTVKRWNHSLMPQWEVYLRLFARCTCWWVFIVLRECIQTVLRLMSAFLCYYSPLALQTLRLDTFVASYVCCFIWSNVVWSYQHKTFWWCYHDKDLSCILSIYDQTIRPDSNIYYLVL